MQPTNSAPVTPSLNALPESQTHYNYLRDFRVDACPLFKQHQCLQHRPYTCFYWHFANQRRRRPMRLKDGTFNYSADVYCDKYDENSGYCPEGENCQLLHRVAGDVERKFHVRYYKTALCVHATDSKGLCTKNGAHCAFAHSTDDLRNPIFDIREVQNLDCLNVDMADGKDRTSFVVEDPAWQNQEHVLSCYKTEPCKKPPRLCRQGYACPFYHNNKDRRRPPAVVKYRSTPCPQAKASDEWAEPDTCDQRDQCHYCHSRTEQQFHPEIYKSTKCNDMLSHGYCPRGPFCAFAHTDEELHATRDVFKPPEPPAPTGINGGLSPNSQANVHANHNSLATIDIPEAPYPPCATSKATEASSNGSMSMFSASIADVGRSHSLDSPLPMVGSAPSYSAVLQQRRQTRNTSGSSDTQQQDQAHMNAMAKAPGFERNQTSPKRPSWNMDIGVPTRNRTTSLTLGTFDLGYSLDTLIQPSSFSPYGSSKGWPNSPSNNPNRDFECQLVGGSLLEELSLEESLAPIAEGGEEIPRVDSSDGSDPMHPTYDSGFYGSSAPVLIPARLPGSPYLPDSGNSGHMNMATSEDNRLFRMSGSFNSQSVLHDIPNLESSPAVLVAELQKSLDEAAHLKRENASYKLKYAAWESGLAQARKACEAWQKEAELHKSRAYQTEVEKNRLQHERDAALNQLTQLHTELSVLHNNPLAVLQKRMSTAQLQEVYARIKQQIDVMEAIKPGGLPTGSSYAMCARCGSTEGSPGCPLCSIKNGRVPM